MRILIVEDEAASRRGLMNLLQSISPQNQVVGMAANGKEGLEKLRALKPNVAFVDICMPGMDGLTMVSKAKEEGCSSTFIMVSAYADFSYARKALIQGALDYLVKPFIVEDVENVLQRAAAEQSRDNYIEEFDVQHPMITRTLKMIANQYQCHISLESISEQLQITPEYLSYLFKRDTGINFVTYLRQYRIEKAKQLLQDSDMKIYEIASAVGFSDAKYFCRVFRNVTGQAPSSVMRRSDEEDMSAEN